MRPLNFLRTIIMLIPVGFFLLISCNQDEMPTITNLNQGDRPVSMLDSIQPGDFKTYGQGAWGSPPHGNNPGQYLKNNWNLLDTVVIGCDTVGGETITFTTWQAVNNFLPQGKKPAALDTSYINPNMKITVLAGQVLALALNIGFDLADSTFGNSSTNLKDLCVASGTFEGWTVEEVFDEANKILGGCASNYNASEINNACDMINNNFEGGVVVGNYLEFCSSERPH